MKLAERIASILQDFELRQLEIDKVEKWEVLKEEGHEFQPEEYCAGVTTSLTVTHPDCFENPSGMAFPEGLGPCDESGCEETVAFIRYP
ncbi:unnamed protein product [Heligmosomoides polygyrus]|uniref:Phage_ABA_S domain-containing protein n=1 Tax=Heligmosomoides polygyrus TaxID=6339 RepID=A0A183GDF9_HELPZ|nr:unnamed protein product [Heligmosomoides polygyrus]